MGMISQSSALQTGSHIVDLQINEILGVGSFGITYLVTDPAIGTRFALKEYFPATQVKRLEDGKVILKDGQSTTVFSNGLKLFLNEARIVAALDHPNIVKVLRYFEANGTAYFLMPYYQGQPVHQLLESAVVLDREDAMTLMLPLMDAMEYIHTEGVIHQDIKPANVMLNRRGGESDVVKVLDFGLVKALDDEKQARASGNSLAGTPLYMSPEAIQTPMSVDARSDIYAVGAVGYFLVTGTPVFEAGSLVELCRKHVDDVPEPTSERLGKEIDGALEAALMACLEKSRAKRPQTARDLAQLLRKCSSAGTWSVEEAEAWWGRHDRGQVGTKEKAAETSQDDAVFDRTIVTDNSDSPETHS